MHVPLGIGYCNFARGGEEGLGVPLGDGWCCWAGIKELGRHGLSDGYIVDLILHCAFVRGAFGMI